MPDWKAIEHDYRHTSLSLRALAAKHGTRHPKIHDRAKRYGWERNENAPASNHNGHGAREHNAIVTEKASAFTEQKRLADRIRELCNLQLDAIQAEIRRRAREAKGEKVPKAGKGRPEALIKQLSHAADLLAKLTKIEAEIYKHENNSVGQAPATADQPDQNDPLQAEKDAETPARLVPMHERLRIYEHEREIEQAKKSHASSLEGEKVVHLGGNG